MNILLAGGAGFIGSHIAEKLLSNGHEVIIVDGLLDQTSGSQHNLAHLREFHLIQKSIEECQNLSELLNQADIVIDCMGWTRHILALYDPLYDLQLNIASHLALMQRLAHSSCRKVIYLGSRGQIGHTITNPIEEDEPRFPMDVQGIHKTAAESHYRLFAKRYEAQVLSLVIGNTYGPRMPMTGEDIGLVGGFLRDILADKNVQLYGKNRLREITYAPDLAEVVSCLCQHSWEGFQVLNIPGTATALETLVQTMIEFTNTGSYSLEDWPTEVKALDIGSAKLSIKKFEAWLGPQNPTPWKEALKYTIQSITPNAHE